MSRDPNRVLDALIDAAKNAPTDFKDFSRTLKFWVDCSVFPSFFLRCIGMSDEWSGDGLQRIFIEAEIWFYAKTDALAASPSEYANTLMAQVRALFTPDNDERGEFTLGGLVASCRIEGRTDLDSGDIDGYIKATIPVRILLP